MFEIVLVHILYEESENTNLNMTVMHVTNKEQIAFFSK